MGPIYSRSMETIKLFYGYDPREAVGAHVFLQSIISKCSLPVEAIALTPQLCKELGIESGGTNSFGKIRYAVPNLCDYRGFALFLDGSDMLCRGDLAELWELRNGWDALQVVKHNYQTKHPRKYIGTELEADNQDYPRKNQSSVMVFNCSHYLNRRSLTLSNIKDNPSSYFHRFSWLTEDRIGELPAAWNHLVGENEFNPQAKIAHFTLGQPGFNHYSESEYADEWKKAMQDAMEGMQYQITFKRS